jgi:hypothetical protein
MSDSELSEASRTPAPSDTELENSLRREVNRANKTGDDVTLRQIRDASEKKLGLPEGFYKSHSAWKDRSKEVVQDQVVSLREMRMVPSIDSC